MLVHDENNGQTSAAGETTFDIVESIGEGDGKIVRYDGPNTVSAGETFSFDVLVRNTNDRDSSLVSTISRNRNLNGWEQLDGTTRLNIPGN